MRNQITDVIEATLELCARVVEVNQGFPKGRPDFILDCLQSKRVPHQGGAQLDLFLTAYVQTQAAVELQRAATCGRLRVAIHHADLLTYLVDEDHRDPVARTFSRELAHRLRHHASLQANVHRAHVTIQLCLRYEGSNGVYHD